MTELAKDFSWAAPVTLDRRGGLAGYETSDIACWEAVRNDYCRDECLAAELAEAGLELEPITVEVLTALSERPGPAVLS